MNEILSIPYELNPSNSVEVKSCQLPLSKIPKTP
jgi:hypothetical protein